MTNWPFARWTPKFCHIGRIECCIITCCQVLLLVGSEWSSSWVNHRSGGRGASLGAGGDPILPCLPCIIILILVIPLPEVASSRQISRRYIMNLLNKISNKNFIFNLYTFTLVEGITVKHMRRNSNSPIIFTLHYTAE